MVGMVRILLLHNTPMIPLSSIIPPAGICMPENHITRIYRIVAISLKNIIQTSVQPSLLTIIFSYTLKESSLIRNYPVCTGISAGIRSPQR